MQRQPTDTLPTLLRPDAVAAMLGISLDTVQRWRTEGKGPPAVYLTPRTIRYRLDAVEAWAKMNEGVRS